MKLTFQKHKVPYYFYRLVILSITHSLPNRRGRVRNRKTLRATLHESTWQLSMSLQGRVSTSAGWPVLLEKWWARKTRNLWRSFSKLFFLIDTDEKAFEARDLESDFHDASTTKDPASHGKYDNAIQSSNLTIFLIQKMYISLLHRYRSANCSAIQCRYEIANEV